MSEESEQERIEQLEVIEADTEVPPGGVVRRANTFESFKYRDYTWFWTGSLISNTGTWMQTAALAIVVWGLRSRELDLGLVNFATGIPVLFLALPAGVIADRLDKRRLLIWCQGLLGVQAAALWVLSLMGRLTSQHAVAALVWISGLGLVGGVLSALTFPAWQSFLPDLVPRPGLMNAIALNSAQFQASRLLGPLAASGLLIVGVSTGDIFLVNAASYLFVIGALWAIRPIYSADDDRSHGHEAACREGTWATLTAGVRYARENRVVGMLILSTAFITVLGMPYLMLLPAIAEKALGGGKLEYSWLLAANGLGAVFGSLAVASLPPSVRRERWIPVTIIAMSLLLIAFALSRSLALSLFLSVLAGTAFLATNALTNTSIQAAVPGALRGRVMALFVMAFMGIMPVSSAIFGLIGEWVGPSNAVGAGAIILLGWGAFLALGRSLSKAA